MPGTSAKSRRNARRNARRKGKPIPEWAAAITGKKAPTIIIDEVPSTIAIDGPCLLIAPLPPNVTMYGREKCFAKFPHSVAYCQSCPDWVKKQCIEQSPESEEAPPIIDPVDALKQRLRTKIQQRWGKNTLRCGGVAIGEFAELRIEPIPVNEEMIVVPAWAASEFGGLERDVN
jgi:hypothetical protein